MISPSGLMLKRPGICIPVFFLSLLHTTVSGQVQWPEAASAALGNSFVCLEGFMCPSQNQAGLGFIEHSSLSLQHGRPYLLKELGITSMAAQFCTGRGAMGLTLSSMGIKGFRQSSLWLSYGLRLHPDISAGAGLHFWSPSLDEQLFYAPGIGVSLGLQIRIREKWKLGMRIFHPAAWSFSSSPASKESMSIESGFAYSFFRVARVYAELHIRPQAPIILCGGAEWILNQQIRMRTGICSGPFTFSWGILLKFKRCITEFSFQYRTDTGLSPLTALSYEW
jgi:hypothetical protein